MKNNFGIVFGGGGGKGAYQIGVWEALRELGVDKYITGVSGTSVGALNGALFCSGEIENARKVWLNITQQDILTKQDICNCNSSMKYYQKGVCNNGWFSHSGLEKIIEENVDFEKIKSNKIRFFATASKVKKLSLIYNLAKKVASKKKNNLLLSLLLISLFKYQTKVNYFNMNQYDAIKIKDILLASAALPLIFPDVEIDNNTYIDGGIKDNIPIMPLYKSGFNKIIVVSLDNKIKIKKNKFKGVDFIEIFMDGVEQFESLIDTFDFDSQDSEYKIKQGYINTMKKAKEIKAFFK